MTQGTVKLRELEGPPPGEGLITVTALGPAAATALAGISAVINSLLTKVVGMLAAFHSTLELEMKLVPTTLKVKAAPPNWLLLGDSAVMLGIGLGGGGGGEEDVPPLPQA